jgi:hypothetical protein
MAKRYYKSTNFNIVSAGNWYTNEACTIKAGSLPTSSDDVFILSPVFNGGTLTYNSLCCVDTYMMIDYNNPTSGGGTGDLTINVLNTSVFVKTSQIACILVSPSVYFFNNSVNLLSWDYVSEYGPYAKGGYISAVNVFLYDNAINAATIVCDNTVFYNNSINNQATNTIIGNFVSTGFCNNNATFYDNSINYKTINNNAYFYNNSMNNNIIGNNAYMYNNSIFANGKCNDAYMYNNSIFNNGICNNIFCYGGLSALSGGKINYDATITQQVSATTLTLSSFQFVTSNINRYLLNSFNQKITNLILKDNSKVFNLNYSQLTSVYMYDNSYMKDCNVLGQGFFYDKSTTTNCLILSCYFYSDNAFFYKNNASKGLTFYNSYYNIKKTGINATSMLM